MNQAPLEEGEALAVERSAVRLLARREYSRAELRRKLADRHPDAGLVDGVLDDLQRRGLLSDEPYAELYVAQRVRKGYGPLRIRAELAQRGIEGETAARCLDEGRFDWGALLTEAAVRRFGDTTATDRRALAKRARFLEQRGFPVGLVARYLDRLPAHT